MPWPFTRDGLARIERRRPSFARVQVATLALSLAADGCSAPMLAAESVSVGTTGKPLVDHGADIVTGKNRRVVEDTARKDSHVCEDRDSPATEKDFKGML